MKSNFRSPRVPYQVCQVTFQVHHVPIHFLKLLHTDDLSIKILYKFVITILKKKKFLTNLYKIDKKCKKSYRNFIVFSCSVTLDVFLCSTSATRKMIPSLNIPEDGEMSKPPLASDNCS